MYANYSVSLLFGYSSFLSMKMLTPSFFPVLQSSRTHKDWKTVGEATHYQLVKLWYKDTFTLLMACIGFWVFCHMCHWSAKRRHVKMYSSFCIRPWKLAYFEVGYDLHSYTCLCSYMMGGNEFKNEPNFECATIT